MLFFRYTDEPEKDIKRGFSFHSCSPECLDKYGRQNDLLTIVKNRATGERRVALNGLCCYHLEADTIEEALEEIEEKKYYFTVFDYTPETNSWAIIEGTQAEGQCPDGDICHPKKVIYKKIIN